MKIKRKVLQIEFKILRTISKKVLGRMDKVLVKMASLIHEERMSKIWLD